MFRCSNQHFNFKMMKTEDLYLLLIVMMHHDFKWWWWYSHIPRHEKRQEKNNYPYPGTFLRSKWSTCNEYHGIIWKVSTWSFQYLNNSRHHVLQKQTTNLFQLFLTSVLRYPLPATPTPIPLANFVTKMAWEDRPCFIWGEMGIYIRITLQR